MVYIGNRYLLNQNVNMPVQHPASPDSDEIDLFELCRILWEKKWVILAFTMLVTAVATFYAFTAAQRWTSVAYVSPPRVEQIKAYLEQRRALARADGTKTVDTDLLIKNLFASFVDLSSAQRTKLEFLATAQYYKNLSANADPENARRILTRLADHSLLVKSPGKDQIAPYYTVSFTALTARAAQEVLGAYIAMVNKKAFDLIDGEFEDSLNASVQFRQAELESIEFKLKSARENQIATLQTALATAGKAGLRDYAVGRNNAGNTVIELRDANHLFMLGEKYLSAELDTAKTYPLIFPARYYEIKRELSLLEPLLKYSIATSNSYSFQLSPTLPASRDAPKRSLIIALGILLGGMLGCGWVLVNEAVRKYKIASLERTVAGMENNQGRS
ncbi:LPS O-antigen chain length determinant protein WzzB [Paralcaligenes sp. KSB-10]|uniref:LPS O-antigen chain length determinant protein WzzB n=1 Tax=Paralcaligenes sp. KSB-10 TaxID=2901142 RepID=UPI00351D1872